LDGSAVAEKGVRRVTEEDTSSDTATSLGRPAIGKLELDARVDSNSIENLRTSDP
jgi:hypothetical protein